MEKILWDANDIKQHWEVKDDFKSDGGKRVDRLGYHYTIEAIAREQLKGKDVLELYGGVGMSTHRYARHVKSVTRIEIDSECNELAKINLKDLTNVNYIEGDFVEEIGKLKKKFDFIDADGFTMLDVLFFDNFDRILKLLKDNAVGFYITNNYQFLLSRNFKHNYKSLENKFDISFRKEALKHPNNRSEIFHREFAKALERKSNGEYKCRFIYMRQNISHMLFLRSDIGEGCVVAKVYKAIEVRRMIEKIMTMHINEVVDE